MSINPTREEVERLQRRAIGQFKALCQAYLRALDFRDEVGAALIANTQEDMSTFKRLYVELVRAMAKFDGGSDE